MKKDYFFGLDITYVAAVIFFLGVMIYIFWISKKEKKINEKPEDMACIKRDKNKVYMMELIQANLLYVYKKI